MWGDLFIVIDIGLKIIFQSVAKFGSNWNNAAKASTFYWNLNNSASNANANISSQLLCE